MDPVVLTTASPTPAWQRGAVQHERARALFAKYGLSFEESDWPAPVLPASNLQRIEKPIRMRVHRYCHRCTTTFGSTSVCSGCEHKRCKKCPRYPAKKEKPTEAKILSTEDDEEDPEATGMGATPVKALQPLSQGQSTTLKPDLVHQPIKIKVKRTCHKCDTLFKPSTAKECENCQHVRCSKCPRDPPKRYKYPKGYPGDVTAVESSDDQYDGKRKRVYRKTRGRVHYMCDQCQHDFRQGERICWNCNHERCDQCTRSPPKEPDEANPEVLKSVASKLAATNIADLQSDEGFEDVKSDVVSTAAAKQPSVVAKTPDEPTDNKAAPVAADTLAAAP